MIIVKNCDFFDLCKLSFLSKMRYNDFIDRKISKGFLLVGFLQNRRNQ